MANSTENNTVTLKKKISELPLAVNLRDEDLAVIDQPTSTTKSVTLATLRNFFNEFTKEYKDKLIGIEENANNYIHPQNPAHLTSEIDESPEKQFASPEEKERWNDKYTKLEIDEKIKSVINGLDWKESVESFSEIFNKYPSPEDGWTVNVKDTDITYRFSGDQWIKISSNSLPLATNENDGLLSKEDKDKLNTIELYANNYIHPKNHTPEIISETVEKQFVSGEDKKRWNEKETVENANAKILDAKNEAIISSKNYSEYYTDLRIANHNHDKDYSKITHNHDNVYSKLEHNHDLQYSNINHNHDYSEILNKPTIPRYISELENDEGYVKNADLQNSRHVHPNLKELNKITSSRMAEWDKKSSFSGSYNDLSDKPTIPEAPNVNKEYVDSELAKKADVNHDHGNRYAFTDHRHTIADITNLIIPTKVSELDNDKNFITQDDIRLSDGHVHTNLKDLEEIDSYMIEYLKHPFDGKFSSLIGKPEYLSEFANDVGYVDSDHNHDTRYPLFDDVYLKKDLYNRQEIDLKLKDFKPTGQASGVGELKSFSRSIDSREFTYDETSGLYKHAITHNLDSESIMVRITEPSTGISVVPSYRITSKNSIEIQMETNESITVLIFSNKYVMTSGELDPDKLINNLYLTKADFSLEMTKYIKREIGLGLSSNNFTNFYKKKLDSLNNYTHPANHEPEIINQNSNNRFVKDSEKEFWNNKVSDVSLNGNILEIKKSENNKKNIEIPIPKLVSELTNDLNFIKKEEIAENVHKHENLDVLNSITTESIENWNKAGDYRNLKNKPVIPWLVSHLENDAGYVTESDIDKKISETKYKNLCFKKEILESEWTESTVSNYETIIRHDLNTEDLIINIIDTATKESVFTPYKIIDSNNIKIFSEKLTNLKITIITIEQIQYTEQIEALNTKNKNVVEAINELNNKINILEGGK